MKNRSLIFLCLLVPLIGGCATMEKSIAFGSGVGAAAGTGLGLAVEQSAGSALIGAGIGVIIGGAIGYLKHHHDERDAPPSLAAQGDRIPTVKAPEVRRIWVPERIEGNRYIEGHYLFVIEKPSVFTR